MVIEMHRYHYTTGHLSILMGDLLWLMKIAIILG